MSDITLAEIRKNLNEIIRVSSSRFKGFQLLAVRIFVEKETGNIVPTQKGLTLRLDTWRELVPILAAGLGNDPLAENQDTFNNVVAYARQGIKGTEIAHFLGINRSTVSRHIKRAEKEGLLHEGVVSSLHGATEMQHELSDEYIDAAG